jgi:hypothetical protein
VIIFNATNLILDVQDRIILPRKSREYAGLAMTHLSDAEKRAVEKGYLGIDKMPTTPITLNSKSPSQPIKVADIFK